MKKIFFVWLYLFLISPLKVQKDVANKVLWSKNGLMWSHFEAKPDKTLPYLSSLSYMIGNYKWA